MENKCNEFKHKDVSAAFWKKHWLALTTCIIAGIGAAIGAILVFIKFVNTSEFGAQGTATFNEWSLAWCVNFVLLLILWELLCVGLPAGLFFGLGGYLWWRRLSEEDKQHWKEMNKETKHHRKGDSGAFNLFFFIAYCIYMAIQGDYYTPFGTYPYSYWLIACLKLVMWFFIIAGIIAGIVGLVFLIIWLSKRHVTN